MWHITTYNKIIFNISLVYTNVIILEYFLFESYSEEKKKTVLIKQNWFQEGVSHGIETCCQL